MDFQIAVLFQIIDTDIVDHILITHHHFLLYKSF